MPDVIQLKLGKRYLVDLLSYSRKFKDLAIYLDTLEVDSTFNALSRDFYKSMNFYNLNEDDSSKFYAIQYLRKVNENEDVVMPYSPMVYNKFMMLLRSGQYSETENYYSNYIARADEDFIIQFDRKAIEIERQVAKGDYKAATSILREMNKEFPKMGKYHWLNDPDFDRIKREYPPFKTAAENLKYPPKLKQLDRLKM